MEKTILITGSTDGIGLETATLLVSQGHRVLLHGRNAQKLHDAVRSLSVGEGAVESYLGDLSRMGDVEALAADVAKQHPALDVLINNAGVYNTENPVTPGGQDLRFVVNTMAPYLLTERLLPLLGTGGRVVNVSSAAQSPVNLEALAGKVRLSEHAAYAQSKLALTMWSRRMGLALGGDGPTLIAVNPGSMLGTSMVRQTFGVAGGDVRMGANILCRAALEDGFASASGTYFDNDSGRFAPPHPDALDAGKSEGVVRGIESALSNWA